ncbi:MAG: hypothetical protein ABDI19_02070 [Armatimonadota bacterium]
MLDAARSRWESLAPKQRLLVFLAVMLVATLLTIWQVRDLNRAFYWIFTALALCITMMILLSWRQLNSKQRLGSSLLAVGFLLVPESIERQQAWLQVVAVSLQFVGGMIHWHGLMEQPFNPDEFEEESAEPRQAR